MAAAVHHKPEWISLWGLPSDVLDKVSAEVDYFEKLTSNLRMQVRDITHETIDILLAAPVANNFESLSHDVVQRYATILDKYLTETRDPGRSLNDLWEELDQSVSFYLLDSRQHKHIDSAAVEKLCEEMILERNRLPGLIAEVSNLAEAVSGSVGFLPQVRSVAALASEKLVRTRGELKMGAGILTRQISMANYSRRLFVEPA